MTNRLAIDIRMDPEFASGQGGGGGGQWQINLNNTRFSMKRSGYPSLVDSKHLLDICPCQIPPFALIIY